MASLFFLGFFMVKFRDINFVGADITKISVTPRSEFCLYILIFDQKKMVATNSKIIFGSVVSAKANLHTVNWFSSIKDAGIYKSSEFLVSLKEEIKNDPGYNHFYFNLEQGESFEIIAKDFHYIKLEEIGIREQCR